MSVQPEANWSSGENYDPYVGRWSRRVASEFVDWLAVMPGGRWLDVGCGTGALTEAVLRQAAPSSVVGIDPSEGFLQTARKHIDGATFELGDAMAIAAADSSFDAVASALVLNFVPDPAVALGEMTRVARPGATVGFYVWDYPSMQMMQNFWQAAIEHDPAAAMIAEGALFDRWTPEFIGELMAPLENVAVDGITVPTDFASIDDYWSPFLGGQGPAPTYLRSLDDSARQQVRALVLSALPVASDGTIALTARAWAARGTRGATSVAWAA